MGEIFQEIVNFILEFIVWRVRDFFYGPDLNKPRWVRIGVIRTLGFLLFTYFVIGLSLGLTDPNNFAWVPILYSVPVVITLCTLAFFLILGLILGEHELGNRKVANTLAIFVVGMTITAFALFVF